MIELKQDDGTEEAEYDLLDLEEQGLDLDSEEFPRLTRANYVERVRFARVPDESRIMIKREESPASTDPLYVYYRSMSKIPLLTREEEI